MSGAEAQTMQSDIAIRDGESTVHFFVATFEESAHSYVTPSSNLSIHYSGARNMLLREAFVMEVIKIPPTFFSGPWTHAARRYRVARRKLHSVSKLPVS